MAINTQTEAPGALLERGAAWQRLDANLDLAREGQGRCILVRGEAGIGKTTLVQTWCAHVVERGGVQTFKGGCEALFTPRPLGAVLDIAAALGPAMAQRALDPAAPQGTALFALIAQWLSTPSWSLHGSTQSRRVNVLVVEDVHWADHLTLDFLKYIGRRIHAWPTLLVVTYRDDEVGAMHPLTQVIGELPPSISETLALRPLGRDALRTLSGLSHQQVDELHAVTGGNPFFATEVIASMRENGGPNSGARQTAPRDSHAQVPTNVAAAVLARVQRVGADARAVLELVSLEPGSVEQDVVQRLVGACAPDGIDACVHGGLLQWRDRGLAFRHELARLAVEGSLSPMRRRELHARLMQDLSKLQGDIVDRIAYHAQRADDARAVLAAAPKAAERAKAMGAFREAAAHWKAALRHAHHAGPDARATMLEQWADVAAAIDEPLTEVVRAREQALALRRELGQLQAQAHGVLSLASTHNRLGHRALSVALVEEAIAMLTPHPPSDALARAYSQKTGLLMQANQWSEAQSWGRRAIDLAQQHGLHAVEVSTLNSVGSCMVDSGDDAGFDWLKRSLSLALEHHLHVDAARAWYNGGEASVRIRQLPQALAWLNDGLAYARQHDMDRWTHAMTASLAHAHLGMGHLDLALDMTQQCMAQLRPGALMEGTLQLVIPAGQILQSPQAATVDEARRSLRDLWAHTLDSAQPDEIVPAALLLVEAAWLQDDAQEALRVLKQSVAACAALTAWDWGEFAVWCHRLGEPVESLLAERQQPPAASIAPPCLAELDGKPSLAAALWRERQMPRHEAWALAQVDPTEDPSALAQSIAMFDRLGFSNVAAFGRRQAHRLAGAGVRGIKTGPRTAARSNPFGLTAREMQVTALLVKGLSNADMAQKLSRSERTVEHHVAMVLTKLDARRRSDVRSILVSADALEAILAGHH